MEAYLGAQHNVKFSSAESEGHSHNIRAQFKIVATSVWVVLVKPNAFPTSEVPKREHTKHTSKTTIGMKTRPFVMLHFFGHSHGK